MNIYSTKVYGTIKHLLEKKKLEATKYLQDITQCKRVIILLYRILCKVILCYETFYKDENIHIYMHGKNTGMAKKNVNYQSPNMIFSFRPPAPTLFLFSALILSQGL